MNENVKEFDVTSLTEFIDLIDTEKLDNYYYRGENTKYKKISSSLLREYSDTTKVDVLYGYKKLLNQYYYEVANELSEVEKHHFVAFSQHHSLKTNLIDFTPSPLIALYFACDMGKKKYSKKDDIGYVYLIDKNDTIDASDVISNYLNIDDNYKTEGFNNLSIYNDLDSNPNILKNLLNYYFSGNSELYHIYRDDLLNLCDVFNHLPNYFEIEYETIKYINDIKNINDYITEENLNKLIDELGVRDINDKDVQKFVLKNINKKMCEDILDKFDNYRNEFINKWHIDLGGGCLTCVLDFLRLLKSYFSDINIYSFSNEEQNFLFPQLPYLIYKTPYKFDRIKNQNGIFLYQGFYTYNCHNRYNKTIIQSIIPNIIIKVHNKKKVFDSLDMVGINRKFIYGDYDNTARYINEKYII